MELIQHAQALPWSVDAAFFWQLTAIIAQAVGLLLSAGLLYAGLHRLLSNRGPMEAGCSSPTTAHDTGSCASAGGVQ